MLSALGSDVYSQEEMATMAGDNAGIGIGEIIDEEGGSRIGVNHLNPNDPYLTNDQKQALKRVGKTLPCNNRPGMTDFAEEAQENYGKGYDKAHGQAR